MTWNNVICVLKNSVPVFYLQFRIIGSSGFPDFRILKIFLLLKEVSYNVDFGEIWKVKTFDKYF
jgi:hypothetical protein